MFTGRLDEVKKDLEMLYEYGVNKRVRQILVRRMEHTSTSQSRLKELSQVCIDNYEECIGWVKTNYPDVVFTVPILKDTFRGGNNEYFIEADKRIETQKRIINSLPIGTIVNLICPLSGYEYFTKAFEGFENVKTNLILNNLYGGSVTVAGLLKHQDIREQFHPRQNDVMMMPKEMYNVDGMDLLGEKVEDLEKYYNAKIILA